MLRHLVTVGKRNGKNFYAIGDPHVLVADLKQRETLAADVAERVEKRLKTAGSLERGILSLRSG